MKIQSVANVYQYFESFSIQLYFSTYIFFLHISLKFEEHLEESLLLLIFMK